MAIPIFGKCFQYFGTLKLISILSVNKLSLVVKSCKTAWFCSIFCEFIYKKKGRGKDSVWWHFKTIVGLRASKIKKKTYGGLEDKHSAELVIAKKHMDENSNQIEDSIQKLPCSLAVVEEDYVTMYKMKNISVTLCQLWEKY